MSGSWQRIVNCCLLFYVQLMLVSVDEVIAKGPESTVSDSESIETVVKEPLENDEAVPNTVTPADSDEEKKTTVLHVNVFQKGEGDLPIKDARVIVTYQDATEYERKTNAAGVATLSDLPYGEVDLDVTSPGRQSDGGALVLDEPKETSTFHLKLRPIAE